MAFLKPVSYPAETNPFIEDLGDVFSGIQWFDHLTQLPQHAEDERSHSQAKRKMYTSRLDNFFIPNVEQIRFAERLHEVLITGYAGRDPRATNYVSGLQTRDKLEKNDFVQSCLKPASLNTARSFSVFGSAGMGKSVAADRILRCYPQGREIVTDFLVHQLVWVKLECPRNGSLKQLCLSFFQKIDSLLGSEYYLKFKYMAVDSMIVQMSIIARTHALGVLVIDEIQHLAAGRIKGAELLNFITQLVNQIEIPVIMIGTEEASKLFEASIVQGRRASGIGHIAFDRFENDEDWRAFVTTTWQFQWTSVSTEITRDLIDVFYEETQGITSLFLTLYALTQREAIDQVAWGGSKDEPITVELVKETAKREFKLLQKALGHIRKGRRAGAELEAALLSMEQETFEEPEASDTVEFKREKDKAAERAAAANAQQDPDDAAAKRQKKPQKPKPLCQSQTELKAQKAIASNKSPADEMPRWKPSC